MRIKDQFENAVWAALLCGLTTTAVVQTPSTNPKCRTIRPHRVDPLVGLGALTGGAALAIGCPPGTI